MNDFNFKKGIESVNKVRMTGAEKKLMAERILHAPAAPVRSPWQLYSFTAFYKKNSRAVVSAVCVLALVFSMSNVAFAAHGSLPGDLLYPVKTKVLEPVQEALAVTADAKAGVHAQIAETRLEEAEELASEGRLNADNEKGLEDSFHGHAAAFAAASTSATTTASFHAKVAAHASALLNHGADVSAAVHFAQSARADIGDRDDARGDAKPAAPEKHDNPEKNHGNGHSHPPSDAATTTVSASPTASMNASSAAAIPVPTSVPSAPAVPAAVDSAVQIGHDKIGL